MNNLTELNLLPEVKIGIVAVSRDCFPESLSVNRRKALVEAYTAKYGADAIYECPVCIVESEIHMVQALEDIRKNGCNALCVYLGNFGPEISETLLAKHFDGPAMYIAAAEESQNDLVGGRGDAYCGMLNASYNLKLRNVKAYIPENPVGTAAECADRIHEFIPIARAIVGLSGLKIISFGPRPLNFLACNAPIKQLFNLGVEIEENSELDLFESFKKHEGDERIPAKVKEMEEELTANMRRGVYIVPVQEDKKVPLMKIKEDAMFQPIFTDMHEFNKFGGSSKFHGAVIPYDKLTEVVAEQAKGVVINPLGVHVIIMKEQLK